MNIKNIMQYNKKWKENKEIECSANAEIMQEIKLSIQNPRCSERVNNNRTEMYTVNKRRHI